MQKNRFKLIALFFSILFVIAFFPALESYADTVSSGTCGDHLTWKLDDKGTLTISGSGEMGPFYGGYLNKKSVKTIEFSGTVTSIGGFKDFSNLTGITIPRSVTKIGSSAFSNCSSLKSITIPNSVILIGDYAFEWCTSLTSVILPDSLTEIQSHTFDQCRSLTTISIPDGVTTIGYGAFSGCKILKGIDIPNSVTIINERAFENCISLSSISLPDNIQVIPEATFLGCTGLTSVVLPKKLKIIERNAFSECSSLNSIIIPDSVTRIGDDYFTSWGGVFSGCTSLTKIVLPKGLTKISNDTFDGCSNLKSITIPASVTSIGEDAFINCIKLDSITIPDGVTSIGTDAFYGCTSLASVTIPDSLTNIGYGAFSFCDSLTDVYYGDTRDNFMLIKGYNYLDCYENITYHYKKIPLKIITQPVDFTGPSESTATFKVAAQGDVVKYQWQVNSTGVWQDYVPAGNADEISLAIVFSRDGYKFRCIVTDYYNNTVISDTATLHLYDPVSITSQPSDYTAIAGNTAVFNVGAKGSGIKYQWQTYSAGNWVNSSLPGAKTQSLSVPATKARDGYKFRCVLTDAANKTVTTNEVTLRVTASGIGININPRDYTGSVGSTAIFEISATGIDLKYQWQAYSGGKWVNSSLTGAKTPKLSVPVTYARNGYKFRCVVTDSFNQTVTSKEATLNVTTTPLSITTQPKNYTGAVGSTAKFTVAAAGAGLKYQWQAYTNGKWVNSSLPGYNTATLSVPVISSRNGYKFRCIVKDSNNQTVISDEATLHVTTPVVISTQPKDYTGPVGSTAEFKVTVQGTELKYQWQTYSSGTWKNSSLPGYNTTTLSVPIIVSRDGYKFRCVVKDSNNQTVISDEATLHVTTPVVISIQPKDYTGPVGSTAEFKVTAQGTGLKYQWQTYSSGTWKNSSLPGYNTTILSVPVIVSRDSYQFRCVISDSLGNTVTSKTATLHVDNTHTSTTNAVTVTTPSNLGLIVTEEEQAIPEPEEREKMIFDTENTIESVITDAEEPEAAITDPEPVKNVENTDEFGTTEDNITGITGTTGNLDDALTVVDKEADTVDTVSAS